MEHDVEHDEAGGASDPPSVGTNALLVFLAGAVFGAIYTYLRPNPALGNEPFGRLAHYAGMGIGIMVFATVVYLIARAAKSRSPIAVAWGFTLFFMALALVARL